MKLPDNKNERIKILAMIAMGGIAVLFAIHQLIILPAIESYKKSATMLEKKQDEQTTMTLELRKAQKVQSEFNTVGAQVQTLSLYLAQPILGTYLIGIQSGLEQSANEAGLRFNPASEIGFAEIPGKKKDGSKYLIKSYSVRITGTGGYPQLLALVRQLEESNPLLYISELSINSQPSSPESHQINCSIEWPVSTETEKNQEEIVAPEKPAPATQPATVPEEEGP